jgi:cytochrome c-type biogenesis protein CcmF
MWLAHLGVALFIGGVTGVRTHEQELDVRMQPGQTAELRGYSFRFDGAERADGPNYAAMQGRVQVTRSGETVAELRPEKRVYHVQRNPMTEAAIHSNLARDLYVSLGEPQEDGSWTLRLQVKPLIAWIWLGCLVMALGGALAASDRRYRATRRATAPLPTAAEGAIASGPSAGPLPSRPAIPSGDRPAYPSGEGLHSTGPLPSRPAIPSGDRPAYPSAEGLQ